VIARSLCLALALCAAAACDGSAPLGVLPTLRGAPSTDRPAWLRDLPAQIERHPAPQGWGGDSLAGLWKAEANG